MLNRLSLATLGLGLVGNFSFNRSPTIELEANQLELQVENFKALSLMSYDDLVEVIMTLANHLL